MSSIIDRFIPIRKSTFLKYKEKKNQEIAELKIKYGSLRRLTEYKLEVSCPEEKRAEYLKAWYMGYKGRELNLENPRTLDEKIQWLKLNADSKRRGDMADKYKVRSFVKENIGEEYLIPLIGVYDSADEIDFELLPERFVIKANHGCAYNLIVKDKSKLDVEAAKKEITRWMGENYAFIKGFELQYENIERKIIIEEYIEDKRGNQDDFKFYCMKDHVEAVIVCMDRYVKGEATKFFLFNEEWELQRVNEQGKKAPEGFTLPKPINMNKMFELARELSVASEEPFVRVDFYNCDGKIYFGEMTFTPASGVDPGRSHEYDLHLGSLVELPCDS